MADNKNKAGRDGKRANGDNKRQSVRVPASALTEARTQVVTSNALSLQFSRFATNTAQLVGHPYTFFVAVVLLFAWAATGPVFHFSDTWQLIINTSTTIITFLVVFLIQNTQNRDARAVQLKLDELIRAMKGARNRLVDLEQFSDEELLELEKEFQRVRARADKVSAEVRTTDTTQSSEKRQP